jgi:hypothetical protein
MQVRFYICMRNRLQLVTAIEVEVYVLFIYVYVCVYACIYESTLSVYISMRSTLQIGTTMMIRAIVSVFLRVPGEGNYIRERVRCSGLYTCKSVMIRATVRVFLRA